MLAACLSVIALVQLVEPPPRIERLDNGLRVVVVQDRTLPLLSVQLWYQVGSAYDNPQSPGLCHVARTLLEHRDQAALRLRAAAVRFESRTLRDACCFASVLPPNFLEHVLQIEAVRMRPLKATPEMVRQALATAARDYGLQSDDAEQTAERQLLAAMFPDHPYTHPPGFVAESLKSLSAEDVDEFLERWFVPGNATLLIIGDVSDVRAMELVRKHFDPLPWAEPPRRVALPSPEAQQIRLSTMVVDRAGLDIAWLTPPAGYFENAAIEVLMHRLCNRVDGPLAKALAELGCPPPVWRRAAWREHGVLVLSVEWGGEATEVRGSAQRAQTRGEGGAGKEPRASARAASGGAGSPAKLTARLSEIECMIREQLKKAEQTVPSEIQFNRARSLAARDVMIRCASFSQRARRLAWHELIAGDLLLASFERPRVAGLHVADVQHAAGQLRAARTVVLRREVPSARGPGSPNVELSAPLPPALRAKPPGALDGAAALGLLRRHAGGAPPIKSPRSPATLTTHELGNGVRIVVCAVPGLQPAEVRTLLPESTFPAQVMQALLAVGSERRSADQLRDYLSYHELDLYPLPRRSRPGLASRGPATHIAQMIELQADSIRHPKRAEATHESAESGRNCAWKSVTVLVVGDVGPEAVCEAGRLAWADWQPSAAGDQQPETGDADARSPDSEPVPAPYTSTHWSHRRAGADQPPWLGISDTLWPPILEQPERELALHCVGWTFGARQNVLAALDAEHAWSWTWSFPEEGHLMFDARPASGRVVPLVESWLARMSQVRRGELPHAQVGTALRLARADRLASLDTAAHIADLLERGVFNPWDLLDAHGPAEFLGLLRRAYRVHIRSISGSGAEDRSDELRRFEHDPGSGPGRPDSPDT